MAKWGVGTWDKNGVANNYGIKPMYYVDFKRIESGSNYSFSYIVPSGYSLGFYVLGASNADAGSRSINISGGNVTVSNSGGNYGSGDAILYIYFY